MVFLQIDEVSLAIGDHTEKSAAGVIVFLVFLEMIGQFFNSLGKQSDLNFGGAGILVMDGCFLDDFGLLSCG